MRVIMFILLFLFFACGQSSESQEKTMEKDGGIRITVSIDVPGLIDNLAGRAKQKDFRSAMEKSRTAFLNEPGIDVVSAFIENYEMENAHSRLAYIFHLHNSLNFEKNLTNKEVGEKLRKEVEHATDRIGFLLENRLGKALHRKVIVRELRGLNSLEIDIPGGQPLNKERLIRMIEAVGFVGFWEGYEADQKEVPTDEWPAMDGSAIKEARATTDSRTNNHIIDIFMTAEGARIWEDLTERNIKKPILISMDGNVYSAPVVMEKISGGKAGISGNFTKKEAEDLTNIINSGALPCGVKVYDWEEKKPKK